MRGYKVFNPDWTCRGFQYSVGETYEEDVKPFCCQKGFHFCTELKECFSYYSFDPNNKVAEVEALGDIDTERIGNKHCTNKIKIIRELSWEEVLKKVNMGKNNTGFGNTGTDNNGNYNTGSHNTGNYNTNSYNNGNSNSGHRNKGNYNSSSYNTGNYNSGCCNNGDYNSGGCNNGDCNSGFNNSGYSNSGYCNNGDGNSGNHNTGNRNSGDWNYTNYSCGCFNTEEPKIFMFNKPSNWTIEDWYHSKAMIILDRFHNNSIQWIPTTKMTKEEKEQYPDYEILGGYLRKRNNLESNQLYWDKLSKCEKEIVKSLPNFDAVIFKKITGIDVNKDLHN